MIRRLLASISLFAMIAGGPLHAQETAVDTPRGTIAAETAANGRSAAQQMLLSAFDAAVKQVLSTNPDLLDNVVRGYLKAHPEVVIQSVQAASAAQPGALDTIIRDYLMAHPEVILQSVGAAQQRQQIAQQEQAKQTIVDNREKLFADANAPVIGNPAGDHGEQRNGSE